MMRFTSLSHKSLEHSSIRWHESRALPGVRYALRRISLANRIELTERARDLCNRYEFLKAGDTADQLEASLADLRARQLYIEWGLAEITGLTIDGQAATPETLIRCGPESLTDEIIAAIHAEIGLTDEERKNS